eukprot:5083023-Karenia_brevis.AAC.1
MNCLKQVLRWHYEVSGHGKAALSIAQISYRCVHKPHLLCYCSDASQTHNPTSLTGDGAA